MTARFQIRVPEEELARWKDAAGTKGVSAWLRGLADRELSREDYFFPYHSVTGLAMQVEEDVDRMVRSLGETPDGSLPAPAAPAGTPERPIYRSPEFDPPYRREFSPDFKPVRKKKR
jgi:hypothetical protein